MVYRKDKNMKHITLRKQKLQITMLFLLCFVQLFFVGNKETVSAASNWRTAYKKYLEHDEKYKYFTFEFCYVDNDKTPEIYAIGESHADGMECWTTDGKNVSMIKGCNSLSIKKKYAYISSYFQGFGDDEFYKIKNGKWIYVDGGRCKSVYINHEEIPKYEWYKNNAKNNIVTEDGYAVLDDSCYKSISQKKYEENVNAALKKMSSEANFSGKEMSYSDLLKELNIKDKTTKSVKKVGNHIIFSSSQIDKRIKTIKDYYYNKRNQLTTKTTSFDYYRNGDKNQFNFKFYFKGNDLLFAYGTAGKTEYRLFFYKKQLIQMYIDKPNSARKTYTQYYKYLDLNIMNNVSESDLKFYLDMENHARRVIGLKSSAKMKKNEEKRVVITKISGNTITFHELDTYGSDGYLWSISSTAYTAKLSKNVKIMAPEDGAYDDGLGIPYYKRSKEWLAKKCKGYFGYTASLDFKNGEVVKISALTWM